MIPPLFEEAPTLVDETVGVRVWFFDDTATVVDQATTTELSMKLALYLTQVVEPEAQRRYAGAGREVTYAHDWTAFETYDLGARVKLIEWGRTARHHMKRTVVCLSSTLSPFARIAGATGISMLKAVGIPIEQVASVEALRAALKQR